MRRILYSLLFILSAHPGLYAQSALPAPRTKCPAVWIAPPEGFVKAGDAAEFIAQVEGAAATSKLRYTWTVSAGAILSGQGQPVIMVDTTGLAGKSITATVEIDGLETRCARFDSAEFKSITRVIVNRPFDSFGNIAPADREARLDSFANELTNWPLAEGYLMVYGARRSHADEVQAIISHAKRHLIETRKLNPTRIIAIEAGYREELTVELWFVPTGAFPPPSQPTVDESEVEFIP